VVLRQILDAINAGAPTAKILANSFSWCLRRVLRPSQPSTRIRRPWLALL